MRGKYSLLGVVFIWIILMPISVQAQTDVKIQTTQKVGCLPLQTVFWVNASNVASYQWSFGNGYSSTLPDPSVIYKELGEFDISVILTYQNGKKDTLNEKKLIRVIDKSIVDFELVSGMSCDSARISFINKTTDANRYLWDFGDGSSSTEENPVHYYTRKGKYTVSLIAYNEYGCGAAQYKEQDIEIETLDLKADKLVACEDETAISFEAIGKYKTWKWDFGDGNQSTAEKPVHTYQKAGDFNVTLTVEDQNGCKNTLKKDNFIKILKAPENKITVTDGIICDLSEVEFSAALKENEGIYWKFSDNYISTTPKFKRSFENSGSYHVEVTIKNEEGCTHKKTYEDIVQVMAPVETIIETSELEGCAPLTVNFRNLSPDGAQFNWKINSQNLNGKSVNYTFENGGEYTITAITKFSSGCEQEYIHHKKVIVRETDNQIVADELRGCVPFSTTFNLENTTVSKVKWDVGTGKYYYSSVADVGFTQPGVYPVSVTFEDQFGCPGQLSLPVPVVVLDTLIPYTSPDAVNTCSYSTVDFYGGMGKDFWEWDFGDGNTSTAENPSHIYSKPGTYQVSLKTNNANGCATTIPLYNEIVFTIMDVDIDYTIIEANDCPSFTVQFEALGSNLNNVTWDFGPLGKTNELNPVRHYSGNGQTNVKLTLVDEFGCAKSKVSIIQPPWPYCEDPVEMDDDIEQDEIRTVTYHTISSCSSPFSVSFSKPWENTVSVLWHFGDGNTSTAKNPRHTYAKSGTYFVDFYAEFEDGTHDFIKDYVTVNVMNPAVDFMFSTQATCNGVEARFVPSSTGIKNFTWIFNDGFRSDETSIVKNYPSDKVDQVVLTGTDQAGCKATAIKNLAIGNPFPVFKFQKNICLGESISILHNLTAFTGYKWIFGDGTTSTEKYPAHQFTKPGKHLMLLEVTDESGCPRLFYMPDTIEVNHPVADFEVAGAMKGCNSLPVTFKNKSTGAATYKWDFGNGKTSTAVSPKNTYQPGLFTVELIARKNGCESKMVKESLIQVEVLSADFDFIQESTCLPSQVAFTDKSVQAETWHWDFGDGSTSKEQNPTHVYNKIPGKNVTLKVGNSIGCSVTKSKSPDFFKPTFKVSDKEGCYPFSTTFEDQSKGAVSWLWDFGDGTTSTEKKPKHTYQTEGEFTVSLKVASKEGCTETIVKSKMISVGYIKADFTMAIDESICAPLLVNYTDHSIGATAYEWDFGDDSKSSLKNPFHVYNKVGLFDVMLTVSNKAGCKDSLLLKESITTSGPETDFALSDTIVCNPQNIKFTDLSVSAVSWQWFFGDGHVSTSQNPVHQYDEPGIYSVTLSSVDSKGCKQIKSYDSLKVYLTPRADFTIDIQDGCMPVTVHTRNLSNNLQDETYHWDFGNGNVSSAFEPVISYKKAGAYELSLVTTNGPVCLHKYVFDKEIIVRDTFSQKEPIVHQLTVSDQNLMEIMYETDPVNSFKYHVLYRKSDKETSFAAVDTLRNQLETRYYDKNVSPELNYYQYILQTHSYCNDPAPLKDLITYQSIRVKSQLNDLPVLQWNPYKGHSIDHYLIERRTTGSNWSAITTIDQTKSSFTDTELCPDTYQYRVVARNLNGKSYHSASNLAFATVTTDYTKQTVEVVKTTVIDENQVLTEWNVPDFGVPNLKGYEILRSVNEGPFRKIKTVPAGINIFVDEQTLTSEHTYTYKIEVKNTCEIGTAVSNIGTSVLLQKQTQNYKNKLFWNFYQGWTNGVSHYLLQVQDEFGEWKTIKVFENNEQETEIDLEHPDY